MRIALLDKDGNRISILTIPHEALIMPNVEASQQAVSHEVLADDDDADFINED